MQISHEYIAAIVLVLGSLLKLFGIAEIGNETIEGIVAGAIALWIAIRRKQKGDINLLGVKH